MKAACLFVVTEAGREILGSDVGVCVDFNVTRLDLALKLGALWQSRAVTFKSFKSTVKVVS